MYCTEINSIKIPFLHDAAIVCDMKGFKLKSIYVDPSGECAISYWGDLSLMDRATILQNYLPDDVSFDECYKMAQERIYSEWVCDCSAQHPNGYTQIFTPDGLDYRTLRL